MAAADRPEDQIRQLLIDIDSEEEYHSIKEPVPQQTGRENGSKAAGSRTASSSSTRPQQQLRTAATRPDSTLGKRAQEINKRLDTLKSVFGGSFPVFNDGQPDPGCQFEQQVYRQLVDPVHYTEKEQKAKVKPEKFGGLVL
jgi:hypothetical protein